MLARVCPVLGLIATTATAQLPGWTLDPQQPPRTPGKPVVVSAERLTRIRLAADAEVVGPDQTFHLAVVFDIDPGWHVYWKNPGEGAMEPSITVKRPAGFEVRSPRWTRPTLFPTEIGDAYGYQKQAVIFVPIKTPPTLEPGVVTFEADIHWAVCQEVCHLGHVKRSVTVKTSPARSQPRPKVADPVVAKHFARVPKHLRDARRWGETFTAGELLLSGPAHGRKSAFFFPDPTPGITFGEPTIIFWEDRFSLSVDVEVDPGNALGKPMSLGGVIALGDGVEDPSYDFLIPVRDRLPPEKEDGVGEAPGASP